MEFYSDEEWENVFVHVQNKEERFNPAKVNEWIIRGGFHADIPALRAMYPALMTLEDWLRKTGWAQGAQ